MYNKIYAWSNLSLKLSGTQSMKNTSAYFSYCTALQKLYKELKFSEHVRYVLYLIYIIFGIYILYIVMGEAFRKVLYFSL